jgi:hypothetical protein
MTPISPVSFIEGITYDSLYITESAQRGSQAAPGVFASHGIPARFSRPARAAPVLYWCMAFAVLSLFSRFCLQLPSDQARK